MCQSVNLLAKMAVDNVRCLLAYSCGGHTEKLCYNFVTPINFNFCKKTLRFPSWRFRVTILEVLDILFNFMITNTKE